MILGAIELHNFRNFERFKCTFDPHFTLLLAPNSSGKTNILEAIYFSLSGAGFRESREIELINYHGVSDASVTSVFDTGDGPAAYKIAILAAGTSVKKAYFVGGSKVTHPQYMRDQTRGVLFAPAQIEILTGSPDKRRAYINTVLSSYDPEYRKRLANYESALRKRNKLLESHYGQSVPGERLAFWDGYLIEQATYISGKRRDYTEFVNARTNSFGKKYTLQYHRNDFTTSRLEEYRTLEMRIGRTVIGPQKDDFEISMGEEGKNVALFGSRSQQRLAILWLKLSEIEYCRERTGYDPILLLDDVFSEFDSANRKAVLELIARYQTIATTTEQEIVRLAKIPHSIVRVKA